MPVLVRIGNRKNTKIRQKLKFAEKIFEFYKHQTSHIRNLPWKWPYEEKKSCLFGFFWNFRLGNFNLAFNPELFFFRVKLKKIGGYLRLDDRKSVENYTDRGIEKAPNCAFIGLEVDLSKIGNQS